MLGGRKPTIIMTIIYIKGVQLAIEVVGVVINCVCACVCSLPGHCKTNVINYLYIHTHTVHFLASSLISIITTASQEGKNVGIT